MFLSQRTRLTSFVAIVTNAQTDLFCFRKLAVVVSHGSGTPREQGGKQEDVKTKNRTGPITRTIYHTHRKSNFADSIYVDNRKFARAVRNILNPRSWYGQK